MPKERARCTQTDAAAPIAPPRVLSEEVAPVGSVRVSKMSRRRAYVLLGIHVAVFLHILHWKLAGRTLTPLEPSEAIYAIASGVLNAGAILMLVSTLATLLVGRWFCGWACHLVALQDLSAWWLARLGIKPKPIRSRWLMTVPFFAGIYMFGWPAFHRWLNREELGRPSLGIELTKEEFWATFPGFSLALLTFLVCGFGLVYLLGSKGFCTYACPYGGIFGVVERLAPARIRVTDACRGCGHCTAVCTSNVAVQQEVRDYGMVVDPGCMKCLDCVSVCPENALYFGLGKPALLAAPRVKNPKAKTFGFRYWEELALAATFLVTLAIFRGFPDTEARRESWASPLYDVPLLLALGLAGITAFLAVGTWRVIVRPDAAWQHLALRRQGRLTGAGRAVLALGALWFLFLGHSAVLQGLVWTGERAFRATEFDLPPDELGRARTSGDAVWAQDPTVLDRLPPTVAAAVDRAESRFATAQRLALFPSVAIERRRAWLALLRKDPATSRTHLVAAARWAPDLAPNQFDLGRVSGLLGDVPAAMTALRRAVELRPQNPTYHEVLIRSLVQIQDIDGALQAIAGFLAHHDDSGPLRLLRASLFLHQGRRAEGVADLEQAIRLAPELVEARIALAEEALERGDPARVQSILDAIPPQQRQHPAVLELRARLPR